MKSTCTVDRPVVNTDENHKARLEALNLKYGATHVFKDKQGTFWYCGDVVHCGQNIEHNARRMAEIMLAENLAYMGKAYDSDIYKAKTYSLVAGQSNINNMANVLSEYEHPTALNPKLPIEVVRA